MLDRIRKRVIQILQRDEDVINAAPLHYGIRIDPAEDKTFDVWDIPEKPDFVKEAMEGYVSIAVLTDKPKP